jgi:hypothetical protein
MEPAPISPRPPALLTAEASRHPLVQTMPACTMGISMLKSFLIRFCDDSMAKKYTKLADYQAVIFKPLAPADKLVHKERVYFFDYK